MVSKTSLFWIMVIWIQSVPLFLATMGFSYYMFHGNRDFKTVVLLKALFPLWICQTQVWHWSFMPKPSFSCFTYKKTHGFDSEVSYRKKKQCFHDDCPHPKEECPHIFCWNPVLEDASQPQPHQPAHWSCGFEPSIACPPNAKGKCGCLGTENTVTKWMVRNR